MEARASVPPATASTFRVPFGLASDDRLVEPAEAEKGVLYRCPGCRCDLTFRRGTRKRAHFAHRADDSCSYETALHAAGKLRVAEVVRAWLAGGPRPVFVRRCPGLSHTKGCGNGSWQRMPEFVDGVLVEITTDDGLRPDITLLAAGEPVAAIEILATHRVDEAKGARLQLPWVELHADDVVRCPTVWFPVQDHFRPHICSTCEEEKRQYTANYKDGYLRAEQTCWRCKKSTPVYAWGQRSAPDDRWCRARLPQPLPPTMERDGTNRCAHCGAVTSTSVYDSPFVDLVCVVEPRALVPNQVEGWPDKQREALVERWLTGQRPPGSS